MESYIVIQLRKDIASILEFLNHGNCDYKPETLIRKDEGNLISELNMLGIYILKRIRKLKKYIQEGILNAH